jgi:hypothetical protein
MNHKKLSNKDRKAVEERFQKKLSTGKGKMLTYGGRLVLINSVLSSLTMFMMSFFEIPKGILKKLASIGLHSFGKGITIRRNTD